MNIKIDKSLEKDTQRIRSKKLLKALWETITLIEKANSIQEIPHVKKIEGYKNYYRIRLGDYRLGLEKISPSEIKLIRLLHRKEIYRFFP